MIGCVVIIMVPSIGHSTCPACGKQVCFLYIAVRQQTSDQHAETCARAVIDCGFANKYRRELAEKLMITCYNLSLNTELGICVEHVNVR